MRIKLNLWGCISCRGTSDFVTFSNSIDQYYYLEILAKDCLPFAKITHMEDNGQKHTYFLCFKFLKTIGVIWFNTQI